MSRFEFMSSPLSGLRMVERKAMEDHRGFLSRIYCAEGFKAVGAGLEIAQINHTLTREKGSVRGLHFQYPPHAEVKMVTCLQGEIFDVAVDLRAGSPTFLHWHGEILSARNRRSMLIPEGFAHGFQTLTPNCELIYLHTAAYFPEAEGALNVADPRIGIVWPLPISELSDRDRSHPFVHTEFQGIFL